MMKTDRASGALTLFTLAVICAPVPAMGADQLTLAAQLYKDHRFADAEQELVRVTAANQSNAAAHYMLGNTLMAENRPEDAAREYYRAFLLDPEGPIGQYSTAALERAYSALKKGQSSLDRKQTAVSDSGTSDSQPEPIKSSARKVSKQTDAEEQRLTTERDTKIKVLIDEAENGTKQLEAQMQRRMAANVPFREKYVWIYPDPAGDNSAIQAEYAPRIEWIKQDTKRRVDEVKQLYAEKLAALEESAIGIHHSLLKQSDCNINLTPLGTSLYARSYASTTEPTGNPVGILAQPRSLGLPIQAKTRAVR
jgi:tetratricopeptide (TPR) repeat protein